jgi:dehydrogenase/reductase SDR family member 12
MERPEQGVERMRPAAVVVDKVLEGTIALSFSRVGYQVRRRMFAWDDLDAYDATGRNIIVTGATSGLGRAAAAKLASLGASVCLLGRDPERTEAVRAALAEATGNDRLEVAVADLSELEEARRFARQYAATRERLDALVHNAGALLRDYTSTAEGNEVTLATHVLAPFVLTCELFPLLEATPGARVVTVSSGGMYAERLDVAELEEVPEHYDGVKAYAKAKRAQVVLNRQWALRTKGSGVSFLAMHPGWADTPGVVDALPKFHRFMGPWLRSPEQGADTIVWLCLADDPADRSGSFWLDRHERWTVKLPWTATETGQAERLWDLVVERSGAQPPSDHATEA